MIEKNKEVENTVAKSHPKFVYASAAFAQLPSAAINSLMAIVGFTRQPGKCAFGYLWDECSYASTILGER